MRSLPHFNTSNVTIQLNGKCKRLGDRPISIHLMLLFNKQIRATDIEHCYFNTSNVTIQQTFPKHIFLPLLYFNTSNVTIQPKKPAFSHEICGFQYI